jgi:hypothetical protein
MSRRQAAAKLRAGTGPAPEPAFGAAPRAPAGTAAELLFLLGRTRLEGRPRERFLRLLAEPHDWEAVLHLAARHHCSQLAYHHLAKAGAASVPASVMAELRREYHHNAATQLRSLGEFLELLAELEAAGAPAVVWKGPALALGVYPSPELRVFGDYDVIVRSGDLPRVRETLARRGFESRLEADDDELFLQPGQDVSVWNPGTGLNLDVHSGVVHRYWSSAMDCEQLWHRSQERRSGTVRFRELEPASHIIALCLHGAKHRPHPWPALKWITDLEAFTRVFPPSGWEPLLARAAREGCLRRLLLGLQLAADLLDAPLPAVVTDALATHPEVAALVPAIRERLLEPDALHFSFADRLAFDLATRERRRDRWAYRTLRVLTPGKRDHQAGAPAPVASARRLGRLARQYLLDPAELWRLLRGRGTSCRPDATIAPPSSRRASRGGTGHNTVR